MPITEAKILPQHILVPIIGSDVTESITNSIRDWLAPIYAIEFNF